MNHYEELGVDCHAATEEIRRAYKTAVRLLHPDGQRDEELKAMAERQMQRLNGILEILTDPQRRREYDEGLPGRRGTAVATTVATPRQETRGPGRPFARRSPGLTPPTVRPVVWRGAGWVQAVARSWFWVLVGMTCAATAGLWWAVPRERSVAVGSPWAAVRAPVLELAVPQIKPKRSMRVPAKRMAPEERFLPEAFADPESREQGTEPVFSDLVTSAGNELLVPAPPGREVEAGPAEFKASADSNYEKSPFAGNWLHTPQAGETTDPSVSRAVYVEFLVAEENGQLVGSYRAKYNVPDKAISPEVVLRVRGSAPLGKSVRTEWNSGTGAKGVLQMALRPPGLMTVEWWTTEIGQQLQVTSGSAVLVRQQAP